jgi:tetratricopeptide (TPR) repeat protein
LSIDAALGYIDLERWTEARQEILSHLGQEDASPFALALLSIVSTKLKDMPEAIRASEEAIRLNPEYPYAYYAGAFARLEMDQAAKAETLVKTALDLDPEDHELYVLMSAIQLRRQRWKEALAASDQALALDPENDEAHSHRSLALQMMGRKAEAIEASLLAVAHGPESVGAITTHGFALLRQGKRDEAEAAFKEALREDPESDYAREGLLESLRTRFWPYRLIYSFYMWQARFSSSVQWGMWIGLFFGVRLLGDVAQKQPQLAPFIMVVIWCYSAFVLMTWSSGVLANATLLAHPLGRFALRRVEKAEGALAGIAAVVAIVALPFLILKAEWAEIGIAASVISILVMGLGSRLTNNALRWTLSVGVGAFLLFGGCALVLLTLLSGKPASP